MTPHLPPFTISDRSRAKEAFSMIELLLVIACAVILMGLAAPAINSVALGSSLNRAGQLVGDQLAWARQESVTKNSDVQVRFYTLNEGGVQQVRAMQIFRAGEGTNAPVPLGRLAVLPTGIVINSNNQVSPLLSLSTNAGGLRGTTNLASYGSAAYTGFRIRANGMLDAAIGTDNYLTLQYANASGNPPANYYTIQVNPVTGKATVYRP